VHGAGRRLAFLCQKEVRRFIALKNYGRLLVEAKEEAKLVNVIERLQERLAEDQNWADRIKQLEARITELEMEAERKDDELQQTRLSMQEQGKRLLQVHTESALNAEAMTPRVTDTTGQDDMAKRSQGDKLQQAVESAAEEVRAQMQLRLDAQAAELSAARVARKQSVETIGELQRSQGSDKKVSVEELHKVQVSTCTSRTCVLCVQAARENW
jgi:hypothetical protein